MSDAPIPSLSRRLSAEAVGTGLLLAAVVGSGIMGQRLAGGSVGLALLANTLATGTALVALIFTFGPISGAHFDPVVALSAAAERGLRWSWTEVMPYVGAQPRSPTSCSTFPPSRSPSTRGKDRRSS